jgi:2',3'-cyclic-nucleotide 2'-phosphodiesterase/3'-nucleotidase
MRPPSLAVRHRPDSRPAVRLGPRRRAAEAGASATLAVLETTDLHSNVVGYDYFKLAADPSMGLDRTATLIAQARADFPNTVLFDNGDTIQGNALGDYQALVKPVACGETAGHLQGDEEAGLRRLGDRQPRFQLRPGQYLSQVTGKRFQVPASTSRQALRRSRLPAGAGERLQRQDEAALFAPYRIIRKAHQATGATAAGQATVKVGIIGFTPPTILSWDKRWLEGKVYTTGWRNGRSATSPRCAQGRRHRGGDFARRPG